MAVQYNNSITHIKAIGILLMVLGHSGCNLTWLVNIIYMFHMPIFFFASGYCFKEGYINKPRDFVKNKIRGLWVPFVKWGVVFLLLHNLFYSLNFYNEQYSGSSLIDHTYSLKEIIVRLGGILTFQFSEPLLGGYWFLGALFFGSILALFLIKYSRNYLLGVITLVIINLIINLLQSKISILGYTYASQYLLAANFFYLGRLFKIKEIKPFAFKYRILVYFLVVIGSFVWLVPMGAHYYETWKILPYIISATLVVWALYSAIEQHNKVMNNWSKRLLSFVGNNTLPLLTWHFLSFKVVSLIIIWIYNLPKETLASHPVITEFANSGWWLVYFFIGSVIPLICVYFKNKIKKIPNA